MIPTRALPAVLVASTLLAALPMPVHAQGGCAAVDVFGFAHDAGEADAHFRPPAEVTVTLEVHRGGDPILTDATLTFVSDNRSQYLFEDEPAGTEGIEPGDTLTTRITNAGHEGTASKTANTACVQLMATPTWSNGAPVAEPLIAPAGPTPTSTLSATVTASDPENDTIAHIAWGWLSCDPLESDCDDPDSFVDAGLLGDADDPEFPFAVPDTVPSAFLHAGEFWRIDVTLFDEHGAFDLAMDRVRVGTPDDLPAANFTRTPPGKLVAGTEALFDASASADGPAGTPTAPEDLEFRWDFEGDGIPDTAFSPSLALTSHEYDEPGVHAPTLEVRDLEGYVGTASAPLFVNRVPTADAGLPTVTREADAVGTATLADGDNDDAEPENDDPLTFTATWTSYDADCASNPALLSTESGLPDGASPTLAAALVPPKGTCLELRIRPADGLQEGDNDTATRIVGDSPPTATLALGPALPDTTDDLVATLTADDLDGETVTCTVTWTRTGGTPIVHADVPCDSDTLDNAETRRGHEWTATVVPRAAGVNGTSAADSKTIGNAPPALTNVAITPASPRTLDDLTVAPTATDPDNAEQPTLPDPTVSFQWQLMDGGDCLDVAGETASTLDDDLTTKGDTWCVAVLATDDQAATDSASDEVTVLNSAPTLAPAIAPALPRTADNLTLAPGAHDDDGDPLDVLIQWRVGASEAACADVAGETAPTLDASHTDKGETWCAAVTADDGDAPPTAGSTSVLILNSPPAWSGFGILPANPPTGADLSLTGTATDDDPEDTLNFTYAWSEDGTPRPDLTGPTVPGAEVQADEWWNVTATADDGDGGVTEASDAVLVGHSAPVLAFIGDQATPEDVPLALAVSASDVDGDAITFSHELPDGPGALFGGIAIVPDEGTGNATLTFTPAANATGTLRITVIASTTEEGGLSDSETFTVSVTPAEDSPWIPPIPPAAVDEDRSVEVSLTLFDAESDPADLSLSLDSSDPSLLPLSGVVVERDGADVTLNLTPEPDANGVVLVNVTVSDAFGSFTRSLELTVNPVNDPPFLVAIGIVPGEPLTLDDIFVVAGAIDLDGPLADEDILCDFEWSRVDGAGPPPAVPATMGRCLDGAFLGNASTLMGDEWWVTVTPSDGEEGEPFAFGPIFIGNTPPTITDIALGPAAPTTQSDLTAAATVFDPDTDEGMEPAATCRVQWLLGGADFGALTPEAPCSAAATLDDAHTVRGQSWNALVTAYDSDLQASAPAAGATPLTILNSPPVLTNVALSPSAPTSSETVAVDFDIDDPDFGDAVSEGVSFSYQWQRWDGDSFEDAVGETEGHLDAPRTRGDLWRLRVTGTDSQGASDTETTASVTIQNSVPVVAVAVAPAPNAAHNVDLAATVSTFDQDNDTLAIARQWQNRTGTSGPFTNLTGETGALLDDAVTQLGQQYRVIVTATGDPGGAVVATSNVVSVTNSLPGAVVSITPGLPLTADDLVARVTTSDVDGDARTCTFQWTRQGGNPTGTPATTAPAACVSPLTNTLSNTLTTPGDVWTVTVVVSDGVATRTVTAAVTVQTDTDGDGIIDIADNCPAVSNASQSNLDADALGDACDADRDGDGKANASDNCPSNGNPDQVDRDKDGAGDACDATPFGADGDNDGLLDANDNCKSNSNADQADLDHDGVGDACDDDEDGDGKPDASDAFPRNAAEDADLDKDGLGDNADSDDDGDGVGDAIDVCPRDKDPAQADLDDDGAGDVCDDDDDGDGVKDKDDEFPLDATETADFDGDGLGDTGDPDDDNDGLSDADEAARGTDPHEEDSDGDLIGDGDEAAAGSDPSDPLSPPYEPLDVTVEAVDGLPRVTWTVEPDSRLKDFLVFRGEPPEQVGTVPYVPGQTSYSFTDAGFPGGTQTYHVQPRLRGQTGVGFESSLAIASAPFSIVPCPSGSCPPAVPEEPDGGGFPWLPVVVAIVLVLVVGAGVLVFLLVRKGRTGAPPPPGPGPSPAQGAAAPVDAPTPP